MSVFSEKELQVLKTSNKFRTFLRIRLIKGSCWNPGAPFKERTVTTVPWAPISPETCILSEGLAGNLSGMTKAELFAPERRDNAVGEWVPCVLREKGSKWVPGTPATGQPWQRRGQNSLPRKRSRQAGSGSENSIRFKLKTAKFPKYAARAPWETEDYPLLGRRDK